jgi:hypothetical protein
MDCKSLFHRELQRLASAADLGVSRTPSVQSRARKNRSGTGRLKSRFSEKCFRGLSDYWETGELFQCEKMSRQTLAEGDKRMPKQPVLDFVENARAVRAKLVPEYYKCKPAYGEAVLVTNPNWNEHWSDIDRYSLSRHRGAQLIGEIGNDKACWTSVRFAIYSDFPNALDSIDNVLKEFSSLLKRVPRNIRPRVPIDDWKLAGRNRREFWLSQLLAFYWQEMIDWRYGPEFIPAPMTAYVPDGEQPVEGVDELHPLSRFRPQEWFLRLHESGEAIEAARQEFTRERKPFPAALMVSFSDDLLTMTLDLLDYIILRGTSIQPSGLFPVHPKRNKRRLTVKLAVALAIYRLHHRDCNPDSWSVPRKQSELAKVAQTSQENISKALKAMLPPREGMKPMKLYWWYINSNRVRDLVSISRKVLKDAGWEFADSMSRRIRADADRVHDAMEYRKFQTDRSQHREEDESNVEMDDDQEF